MNSSFILHFFERKNTGRQNNIKLRSENKIPSVIYKNQFSISVYLEKFQILNLLDLFFSGKKLISAKLNNEFFFVIIKNFLKHPFKKEILHFDFQKVDNEDLISLDIPIKFVGEKDSIGIKHGGYLVKYVRFIKIKCFVKDIPDFIVVDITNLKINSSFFFKDLNFDKKFIILNKNNFIIASISGSRVEITKESEPIRK